MSNAGEFITSLGWLFQFLQFPIHSGIPQLGRSQPVLHSWTTFSQVQDLVWLDKISLSHSFSLSRFSCRVVPLPKSPVWSHWQMSSGYTWSYLPRHLWMQQAALSSVSLPGDPRLWQVTSLEQSLEPVCLVFWSASSPPTAQTTCLDHYMPASPGGGSGKLYWKFWSNPGGPWPPLTLHELSSTSLSHREQLVLSGLLCPWWVILILKWQLFQIADGITVFFPVDRQIQVTRGLIKLPVLYAVSVKTISLFFFFPGKSMNPDNTAEFLIN